MHRFITQGMLIVVCVMLPGLCLRFNSISRLQDSLHYIRSGQFEVRVRQVTFPYYWTPIVDRYVDRYKTLYRQALKPQFTLHHPLNAYRFIRNMSLLFNELNNKFLVELKRRSKDYHKVLQEEHSMFPQRDDLTGVLKSIINLQQRYDLSVRDLAVGTIHGQRSTPLTAAECLDIALQAYRSQKHYYGRLWLDQSRHLVDGGRDNSITLTTLLWKAAWSAYTSGSFKEAVTLGTELLQRAPDDRIHTALATYQTALSHFYTDAEPTHKWYMDQLATQPIYHKPASQVIMDTLCKATPSKPRIQHLVCKIVSRHPVLRIQPVKLEELSVNPYLVVMHEVFSRQEMDIYKSIVMNKLKDSTVGGEPKPSLKRRSSQSAGLSFDEAPRLKIRVGAITSLNLDEMEPVTVTNYGVGGFYTTHHDAFNVDEGERNRIATFMVYLSDVEAGGATVFTEIGETVFPKAGKAVFWYNLYRNGSVRTDVHHEACPVLYGDKWVLTAWIHNYNQLHTRPCVTDRFT